jgi:hypothetical protein
MKRLLLVFLFALLIIPIASASLGTYKQNDCVNIKTISNGTSVNISSISAPNSVLLVSNVVMTKNGHTFNYTFCQTAIIGNYVYDYFDSLGNNYVNDFEITPSGFANTSTFLYLFIIIIVLIFVAGFWLENTWIMSLGSTLIIILGLFIIVNGVGLIKDIRITWAIGLVVLSFGIYFLFLAAEEQLKFFG